MNSAGSRAVIIISTSNKVVCVLSNFEHFTSAGAGCLGYVRAHNNKLKRALYAGEREREKGTSRETYAFNKTAANYSAAGLSAGAQVLLTYTWPFSLQFANSTESSE